MNKIYVVIYTDFGDSADYKARILGKYKTFEEAHKEMEKDIVGWCKQNDMDRENDTLRNYDDVVCVGDDCRFGCQWQILEMEV